MKKEKNLGDFITWLESEDRQNWEIERYMEYLIIDEGRRIARKLIETKILDIRLEKIIKELLGEIG